MKITSTVLSSWGACSGTSFPDTSDTQIEVPNFSLNTIQLFDPQTLHPGFLAAGVCRDSFFNASVVQAVGPSPTVFTTIWRLAPGVWELDLFFSASRNFGGVFGIDQFRAGWTYDLGVTYSPVYIGQNHIANTIDNATLSGYRVAVARGTTADFLVAAPPAPGAGNVTSIAVTVNAKRLM